VRIGPFRGDQATVPSQDRVGCHDGGNLAQDLPPERLALRGQSPMLVVGQEHALAARLDRFFQDAVLLDQILDDAGLLSANPACERDEK
jgi:hypothetical protein